MKLYGTVYRCRIDFIRDKLEVARFIIYTLFVKRKACLEMSIYHASLVGRIFKERLSFDCNKYQSIGMSIR